MHNFHQTISTIQVMAGAPTPQTRRANRALARLLESAEIPTRRIGSGFGGEADTNDITAIPSHDDFVLILHDTQSLTKGELDFIANLPAPILLLRYTIAGRRVGEACRWTGVAAALGMDPMATFALRHAGFSAAATLWLAEDVQPQPPRRRKTAKSPPPRPFTVISPGDLTAKSEILTLISAFSQFRRHWAGPSRLYLLGRTLDARMAKTLHGELRRENLGDEVVITGSLDDDRQVQLLAEGDVCVFLGVLEAPPETLWTASGRGLPVLAPPAPALSLALGETGLEHFGSPVLAGQLADTLLGFAQQPRHLAALRAAQRQFGEACGVGSPAAVLLNALGRCGLAVPISRAQRQNYVRQLRFTVAGHFEGSYSIAAVNRMLAACLEARHPGSTSVVPVAHHQRLPVLLGIPAAEAEVQQRLFSRRHAHGAPLVCISQHFPPWPPDVPNDLALSLFTWEETLVPPGIVQTLNEGFAGILTVSHFVAKVLVDSGVRRPIGVVGQAVDAAPFKALAAQRAGRRSQPASTFNVLHVSSCFPRKGVDLLLQAWARAFTAADDVRLTIKTFPNPHQRLAEEVEMPGHLAPVTLIDKGLEQAELAALYLEAHCMVLPARGEGFNMVAAEALLAGLPLIVTGFGGHMDFVHPGNARLLDFHFAPSASHVAAEGALWAEPDLDDLVSALREAFAAHRRGVILDAVKPPAEGFDAAAWAEQTAEFAAGLLFDPPRKLRRIAWISSWAVRCGIAEYSKALLEHRKIGPHAPEVLLLCDTRAAAAVGGEVAGATILPCWRLGGGNVAGEIAPHLTSYDPQILVIQHQAGLIRWEDLIAIIEHMRASPARLFVVLHSTIAIATLYHKLRATVLFALASADRILVHTLQDLENLRRLGVFQNVTVLAHGAIGNMVPGHTGRPKLPRSPVLGCYGFFLPHKGIEILIGAFALLLQDWPSARLRLVNAAFPSEVSTAHIRACRALARNLAIEDAIDWHPQFLDETGTQTLLSGCDLIILPYQETPESVSGAVRHALASGSPVAASHSPIFDELGDAVHRVNATGAEALYRDIAGLIADTALCRSVLPNAAGWLARHDWSKTAKRLFDMAEGLWQLRGGKVPGALTLTPRSDLLETRTGERAGGRLIFNGAAADYGLYGPYVSLAAGAYRVIFSFDRCTERRGTARFEVVSQSCNLELAAVERVFPSAGDHETILRFTLTESVPEVEFRIYCHAGFEAAFISVSLELLKDVLF